MTYLFNISLSTATINNGATIVLTVPHWAQKDSEKKIGIFLCQSYSQSFEGLQGCIKLICPQLSLQSLGWVRLKLTHIVFT